jgi:hypothetical protein
MRSSLGHVDGSSFPYSGASVAGRRHRWFISATCCSGALFQPGQASEPYCRCRMAAHCVPGARWTYTHQMAQVPFEVRVEGYEPEPSPDLDAPVVTKADVAQDVSSELRQHFDRYPVDPDTRPVVTKATPAGDFEPVLNDGVRRALQIPRVYYDVTEELAWQVIVALSLSAFFASFMTEAGKDAYRAMKRVIHRLYAAARRQGSTAPEIRTIELRDIDSGLIIPLLDELPDEAYQQLLTITLPPLLNGYSLYRLWWDGGRWILQVSAPVPKHLKVDNDALWRHPSTVIVPLVWHAHDRRWTLPPEGEFGDSLFIQ